MRVKNAKDMDGQCPQEGEVGKRKTPQMYHEPRRLALWHLSRDEHFFLLSLKLVIKFLIAEVIWCDRFCKINGLGVNQQKSGFGKDI